MKHFHIPASAMELFATMFIGLQQLGIAPGSSVLDVAGGLILPKIITHLNTAVFQFLYVKCFIGIVTTHSLLVSKQVFYRIMNWSTNFHFNCMMIRLVFIHPLSRHVLSKLLCFQFRINFFKFKLSWFSASFPF